jgi:hypothetical protein
MFLIEPAFAGESEACAQYGEAGDPIQVTDEEFPDIQSSGVAAARGQENVYYTLDDSGGEPKLYMFDTTGDGAYIGAQLIQGGATNTDWEDLAAGPCPDTVDAEHCLWIADTGDNDSNRSGIVLWVVPESTRGSESAVACNLVYPGGESHDAEALLVGPDRTVRIVTKSGDGDATVYRVSDPRCDDGDAQTLVKEAKITSAEKFTGGAMSADGTQIVLRSLERAWLWTGCTVAWGDTPTEVDLGVQEQGESIAFDNDGSLVTTSEGMPLTVWHTPCDETEALTCPGCGCGGSDAAGLLLVGPLGAWLRRRRRVRPG